MNVNADVTHAITNQRSERMKRVVFYLTQAWTAEKIEASYGWLTGIATVVTVRATCLLYPVILFGAALKAHTHSSNSCCCCAVCNRATLMSVCLSVCACCRRPPHDKDAPCDYYIIIIIRLYKDFFLPRCVCCRTGGDGKKCTRTIWCSDML